MKVEIKEAICAMVEAILPRGSEGVLHIALASDYDTYDFQKPLEIERRHLHFIFYRPSNYTRVLFGVGSGPWLDKNTELTMVSCHDSAWREDGVDDSLNKVQRQSLDELAQVIKKAVKRELTVEEKLKLRFCQPHYVHFDTIKYDNGGAITGSKIGATYLLDPECNEMVFREKKAASEGSEAVDNAKA